MREQLAFHTPHPQRYRVRIRHRDEPSKLETMTVEANDLEMAISKLHQAGYLVVWAKALSEGGKGFFDLLGFRGRKIHFGEGEKAQMTPTTKAIPSSRFHLFPVVSIRELIAFAIQLSALLQAGVPLIRSLQTVQKGIKNNFFSRILERCIEQVRSGFALSHALSQFPKVFPNVWVNLIEVGEASGNLPDVLHDIATYQEATQRVKTKVISAFFYPSVLLVLATGAVAFLTFKIVPQFDVMFHGLQIKLPLITQFVISISNFVRSYLLLLALLTIAAIIGIFFARGSKRGRLILDLGKIKMPIMGPLTLQVSMVRFARGLSTMIRAGVPILRGLEIAGRLVQNAVVEAAINESRHAVQAGQNLGAELEKRGLFPPFMTQLVSVGEESGELERFLELVASYYEERIDTFLARLTTLIEPILLVTIGSVIGVIAVSMILPIVEISTGVH